jgi:hypothetical protein
MHNTTFNQTETFVSSFDWMPTCALVIDVAGNVLDINELGLDFFNATSKVEFLMNLHISQIIVDPKPSMDLIKEICVTNKYFNAKLLFRQIDKCVDCVEICAKFNPNNHNEILILFKESSPENYYILKEMIRVFRQETIRLKPYLNKPGKDILDEIIKNENLNTIINYKPNRVKEIEIIHEKRIEQLAVIFPQLSKSELVLCSFISLKLTIEEIAILTCKSSNSLRVAQHRIIQKLNLSCLKELKEQMNKLTK